MLLSQVTVGGCVDRQVVAALRSSGEIEHSPGSPVHQLAQLSQDWLGVVTTLPGLEGLVTPALYGQQGRQGPLLDSPHGLNVKSPGREVAAGEIQRFTVLTAWLGRQAFVGVEIRVAGGEAGAHPVAGRVDDVHKLGVRPVQSVPGAHTVEQRPTGVQSRDPAQGPACEVSHVSCSLGAQGTAQHVDITVAHSHLRHQPRHELSRLPANNLGVLTGGVVPGRQGQRLPVHRQDVVLSNSEICPPQSLEITVLGHYC